MSEPYDPSAALRYPDDPPALAAAEVVRRLQQGGHVAYLAGGCVRDLLLGRSPQDYDVATEATPDQVLAVFPRAKMVGQAFGVALVRAMGHEVEVATFRTESGYTDGRRPGTVVFTDAASDALRRDFTINGIFYDPIAGALHDYVGGRLDISHRVIRAIGDADARLNDDHLRMLRAARFAARLNYAIEPSTWSAIQRHAPLLSRISRERIGMELRLMLAPPSRALAAQLLQQLKLDGPTLDEPCVERPLTLLAGLPGEAAFAHALGAWLIDRHLPSAPTGGGEALAAALEQLKSVQMVRRWRTALVLSNDERDALKLLLEAFPIALRWPKLPVAQRKRLLAREDWPALQAMIFAAAPLHADPALERGAILPQIETLQREAIAPTPLIDGEDLIAAGFQPGPTFRRVLRELYDAQLEGQITTNAQGLNLAKVLWDSPRQ